VSLPVIWSDEAKAEFYDAERWYADISVHLSERFVQAVENTVSSLRSFPRAFLSSIGSAGGREFGAFLMACFTRWKPSVFF